MSKKSKHLNFEKKIIVFPNKDKTKREKWTVNRDLLNFPSPKRVMISANPDSGKTNQVKNILVRTKPVYKRIYLLHYDPETSEYDDIDAIHLSEIPDPRDSKLFNGDKCAIIIDDQEYKFKTKDELKRLDRLYGYTSTHRFVDIFCCTQDWFNVPPICRRSSNVFFIWKNSCDTESLCQIGRKLGYNKKTFLSLFKHCTNRFDNLCFDLTTGSPAPIRKNSYEKIEKPTEE